MQLYIFDKNVKTMIHYNIKTYSFGTYALSHAFFSINNIMSKSLGLSFKLLNRIPFLKNKIIKSATGSDHLDS